MFRYNTLLKNHKIEHKIQDGGMAHTFGRRKYRDGEFFFVNQECLTKRSSKFQNLPIFHNL